MREREVIQILKEAGFERVDQTGSHAKFRNSAGLTIIVPIHRGRDIGRGLLKKIFKRAGIEVEEDERE
jgi:predicted RNA binding protein YcfA (HicA-like mRNA interferase family)